MGQAETDRQTLDRMVNELMSLLADDGCDATRDEVREYAHYISGLMEHTSEPRPPWYAIDSVLCDESCYRGFLSWLKRKREEPAHA